MKSTVVPTVVVAHFGGEFDGGNSAVGKATAATETSCGPQFLVPHHFSVFRQLSQDTHSDPHTHTHVLYSIPDCQTLTS